MERTLHELHVHQVELEMQNQELRRAQTALEASRTAYADLYDQAPVGYVTLSESGRMLQVNLMAAQLLGTKRQDLMNKPLSDFVTRSSQDAYYLLRKQSQHSTEAHTAELQLHAANGTPFWAELVATAAHDDGVPAMLRVVLTDISQRKAAQERLYLAASVFAQAREGIMITDTLGHILDVNAAFSHITGYSRSEVLGKTPRILSSGRHSAAHFASMWQDLIHKGHWYGEVWNRRKNGEIYAELQTVTAVRDANGDPTHYVALFSDITTYKAQQTQLEHIAHYDLLTDLPNRALLADRLRQSMAQTTRRGDLLGVAYLDLDNFKAINDAHGHEVGDQLLVALANRMKDALRDGDTLARLGGDEFVAVLIDLADPAASLPMIRRLLAAACQPFQVDGLTLQVSASLGVTFFPQTDVTEPDQLLRQADQAMYQAKQAGRNRYHLFDAEQDRNVRGHHEGLERIRLALEQHELVLHYQPKVNMRTGEVFGAEALIRWQHPQKGLLSPLEFLPLIESDPLAIEVGEWVMDTALAQMVQWQAAGFEPQVSVNVGAQQLQHPDFVARLLGIMARYPTIKPEKFMLEMLETSALLDIGYASQVIEDCHQLGVAFALDDFGTGYSSLTYLKRLRVAVLKIDQSFVRDMLSDPDDLSILQGVISLAGAFGRQVIAEGVETIAHGSALLQLGCDQAQGYGVARPMPAADLPAWAATWQPDAAWASALANPTGL
ncbi:EAL domain-containing protein, partial [Rhodoferax sp. 4810]|nr:EAL domain-containing protein [Rhodoferax jenense]